ncbi:hypothetical protein PPACK8108_LOCUS26033 [Phakopsora pachyrhizi]|uniref:Peptidase A2 domain-containing protein n=1 Tax=Phakopsora pachyrhizi TaxID=170000 RepID=A0AAV0BVD6_PHAPC|nr:hypothetical protein PPACK8108_LOCUS26033 [Phakopsora pachyrhizi]
MTRKRVPSGVYVAQVPSGVVDWEADPDVENPRFCTPLGFLEAAGLVDSGSMINVIPEELARKWGLAMVGPLNHLGRSGGRMPFLMDLEARLEYEEAATAAKAASIPESLPEPD